MAPNPTPARILFSNRPRGTGTARRARTSCVIMYYMVMDATNHAWELVFKRDGRVFTELLPAFTEAAAEFERRGCRRVLDLGCGNGRHTVGLAQRGFDVTGLDISMSGLRETCLWLVEEGAEADLICADTRRPLPLQSGCFDAVLSTQVIHHAVIAQLYRRSALMPPPLKIKRFLNIFSC